jgi:D-alanyl-D-alanine carboxypeptidase
MKKILLCFFMMLICQASYGQENINSQQHKKQYSQISPKKKYPVKKVVKKSVSTTANANHSHVKTISKPPQKPASKPIHAVVKKPVTTQNQVSNFAVLAVDANTGEILFAKNAHESRYPASLTKLMTLYVVFDLLDRDRLSLNDKIRFSKNASEKPRSKLGVQAGDSITVKEAINALIVLSANDVAAAVAEHVAGSEVEFGKLMTRKAKALKMYKTNFYNPSGLFHPEQKTTASDMIKLGIALKQNFPQYYKYFSKTSFNFRGRDINGHNRITANYPGAEGLKTGYISQSGFNLISSASRDQKTIFAAVLGGKTSRERDVYMEKLLDASFTKASGRARL